MTTNPESPLPEHRVLASGAVALLGERGKVTSIVSGDEFAELVSYLTTCECELDWNCHLHRNRLYTPIERINDAWASAQPEERF